MRLVSLIFILTCLKGLLFIRLRRYTSAMGGFFFKEIVFWISVSMDDGGWMSFFPCKKFTCLPVVLGLLLSVSKSKAVVVMEYGLMN